MSENRLPEYRRCPVTGRWVIIAPERAMRPITLKYAEPRHRERASNQPCPFCPGHESETPEPVLILPEGSADRWQVRVVPNLYPAVRPRQQNADPEMISSGMFEKMTAFGQHEVIIDCAEHETCPSRLSVSQFTMVLDAVRSRIRTHAQNPELIYATVFKNVGAEAGASLAHSHSQILVTPLMPDAVRLEMDYANDYYSHTKRCTYCDLLTQELELNQRVISQQGMFIAISPYASRFAHEVWILPIYHDSQFESIQDTDLADLATLMRDILIRLDLRLSEPALNLYLHNGPLRSQNLPEYHWHWEIIPQTTRAAGFEWGSGCFINAVPPERSTLELRNDT